jgi:hypothetical protein
MNGDCKVNRLSLIDAIYIAGFIDGEGTITIHKYSGKYLPRVMVSSTNKEILFWIKEKVGKGFISERKWKNKKWKTGYVWILDGNLTVKNFISQIFQFLKIKRLQATLALGVPTKISGHYLKCKKENKKVIYLQDLLHREIKRLNERGVNVGKNTEDLGPAVQIIR